MHHPKKIHKKMVKNNEKNPNPLKISTIKKQGGTQNPSHGTQNLRHGK